MLLSVMHYRKENGLPRRFAPRNDMQKFVARTRCKDVLPVKPPAAAHFPLPGQEGTVSWAKVFPRR